MPAKHRWMTLRDDLVFAVFLYQRWLYRVDYARADEYGFVYGNGKTGRSKPAAKMPPAVWQSPPRKKKNTSATSAAPKAKVVQFGAAETKETVMALSNTGRWQHEDTLTRSREETAGARLTMRQSSLPVPSAQPVLARAHSAPNHGSPSALTFSELFTSTRVQRDGVFGMS